MNGTFLPLQKDALRESQFQNDYCFNIPQSHAYTSQMVTLEGLKVRFAIALRSDVLESILF